MRKTGSELNTKIKPLTDDEIEIKRWCEELKKDCPEVHPYFIEHLVKAYKLNPGKFDKIVENNVAMPTAERINGGTFETVKVYNSVEEIPVEEKK